jgi:FdhE protein
MPTPNDTSDPIILRLRALAQGSPDLQDAARMYEAILPVLRDADLGVGPISLTPEQARAKMKKGQPLLFDLALDLDVEAMRELMLRLARAVESPLGEKRPQKSEAARLVRCALEENRLDIDALLPHIAAGERGTLTSAAQSLQLDPDLVWSLAQSALKPALRAWRRQLTPLAKGISWHKGCCFVCGAVATLAELQENNQCKHLRCGQCGADWQFPRLQCLYCGNEEHKTQGYLYPETRSEVMRVEVCNKCHCYSKIIAAFTPTPPEMLPVEDLATLHLDYLAQELGYSRRPVL